MPQRVIINGAQGKMGSLACETIEQSPDFVLVARLGRGSDLPSTIEQTKAAIVIDLTRADAAYSNTLAIIERGAHPVIGTSGLNPDQIHFLQACCEKKNLGGIIAPNFSIAAVLMMQFSAIAARYLDDVEIIEAHHPQKYDAPSGTAMKTAEMIATNRDKLATPISTKEIIDGARGGIHQGINIHSLRLPGLLARQDVIFGNPGETLSISHNSIDRASFMPGLLLCCRKVVTLSSLYYGLESLLDIK